MPVDIWMESVIQENSPTSATTLSPPLSETDSTGMVVPRIWCSIDVPFLCASFRRPMGVLWSLACPDDIREHARAPVPGVLAEAVAVGTDEALAGAVVVYGATADPGNTTRLCLRRGRPLANPRNHVAVRTDTRARARVWSWLPPLRALSPPQRARSYNTARF